MASKRRLRRKSCEGKAKHKSLENAAIARSKTGKGLNIYKCKFCGSFHIGHPNKKIKQAMAAHKERK